MTISFLKLIQKFIQYKIFYSFIFLEKYTLEKHSEIRLPYLPGFSGDKSIRAKPYPHIFLLHH